MIQLSTNVKPACCVPQKPSYVCILKCLFEDPSAALYSHCLHSSCFRNITNFPSFFFVLDFSFYLFLGGGVSFCACLNVSALWHCGIEIKHSTSRITFPISYLLGWEFIPEIFQLQLLVNDILIWSSGYFSMGKKIMKEKCFWSKTEI